MNTCRRRRRSLWSFRLLQAGALASVIGYGHTVNAVDRGETTVLRIRAALAETLNRIDESEELFPAHSLESSRVLALESRAEIRRVWVSAYDSLLGMSAVAEARAGLRRGDQSFQLHRCGRASNRATSC